MPGQPLHAVWLWDQSASAYVDNSIEAQIPVGVAFAGLGETTDALYFGHQRRIDALMFYQAAAGVHAGLVWEYGAANNSWIRFVPVQDYSLDGLINYLLWDPRTSAEETAWASFAHVNPNPHPAGPPDAVARYWIRVRATTSVTTAATFNRVLCRLYSTYATFNDVQRQLQMGTVFSTTSTPTAFTVEDYLRGAEDELVYQMGLSWRPEFVEEELLNFKAYGMKMRNEDIIDTYELAVWDGSQFDVKEEGRDEDFHVDAKTGMVYVATIFLDAQPPKFRRSYTIRREQGSFKKPVRIRYSFGKDIRRDPLAATVRRITTKKACAELLLNDDFSPLIAKGLDAVTLQAKVDEYLEEWTRFLETYAKTRMF